VILV
jgi:hypothetical protein